MLEIILLASFLTIVALIVLFEYKNNKQYKEQRARRQNKNKPIAQKEKPLKEEVPTEPEPAKEATEELLKEEPETEEEPPKGSKILSKYQAEEGKERAEEISSTGKELPECDYPTFDHARVVESLGLQENEAKEFVGELVYQVEKQIPLIQEAIDAKDFHQQERLTHSIKGSATSLGTGGISDLLVEYNTYLKTGEDTEISQAYLDHLKKYFSLLKEQYS